MDIFNEAMVMFCTYNIFMFTDALPDGDAQYTIGWIFVLMLLIMLGGNSNFVLRDMYKKLSLLIIKKYKLLQREKEIIKI